MESPNSEVFKSPLNWQIACEHVTTFRNGGATKTDVCARWNGKGVSDNCDHFIDAGAITDILKPILRRRHTHIRVLFEDRPKRII
jgi:hypothetical protein